jgi:hypothetical protein
MRPKRRLSRRKMSAACRKLMPSEGSGYYVEKECLRPLHRRLRVLRQRLSVDQNEHQQTKLEELAKEDALPGRMILKEIYDLREKMRSKPVLNGRN